MARLAPKTPEARQATSRSPRAPPRRYSTRPEDLLVTRKPGHSGQKTEETEAKGREEGDIENKKQNQKYPSYKDKLRNQYINL